MLAVLCRSVPLVAALLATPVAGESAAGDRVSGDRVAGDRVAGDRVAGDRIAGDRVSGDRVSGDPVAESVRRYALVVAHNHSDDPEQASLSYADDDGARYWRLLRAAGAEVTLFAVLDPDSQGRFPEAAAAARPPRAPLILGAVRELFARIAAEAQRGIESHFYFVYAGHGDVGPNMEGYVNLLDGRFRRSELYREIVSRSTATYNHLFIDACHAYHFVNKRGGAPDREGDHRAVVDDFLRAEELDAYANTGVILAASGAAETHEWSRWQAGIFSHELQGALLGAADVDGDGAVTYAEAAASVEAANMKIDDPQARLSIFVRPPPLRIAVPLVTAGAFAAAQKVEIPPARADRYYLEDARGIRLADLHPSAEQSVWLALIGTAPHFLHTETHEARIDGEARIVSAAALSYTPKQARARGSVEESFRRHLYAVPFGVGFMRGMQARQQLAAEITTPYTETSSVETSSVETSSVETSSVETSSVETSGVETPRAKTSSVQTQPTWAPSYLTAVGGFGLGLGLLAGVGGAVLGVLAVNSHTAYSAATDPDRARALHTETDGLTLGANICFGTALAIGVAGAGLLVVEQLFLDPDEETAAGDAL